MDKEIILKQAMFSSVFQIIEEKSKHFSKQLLRDDLHESTVEAWYMLFITGYIQALDDTGIFTEFEIKNIKDHSKQVWLKFVDLIQLRSKNILAK